VAVVPAEATAAPAEETRPQAIEAAPQPMATPAAQDETLWSGEEEEAEADAPALPVEAAAPVPPPALSLAEAPVESSPPEALPPPVQEAPPAVRAVPSPVVPVPRLTAAVPSAPSLRPMVPSVGLWGPGARRTGAHAAVAVSVPETSASATGLPQMHTEAPPAVRPVPTPAPLEAAAAVAHSPVPQLAAVAAPPVHKPPRNGHQGGLWSPGAALAELVSEVRAEDARGAGSAEADAVPAEKVAQAASEQRASRERLALMSASEEPTVQRPAVPPRPKKVRPASPPVGAEKTLVDKVLLLTLVAVFVISLGLVAAVLLARSH
jgi:hypothetical protein